MTHKQKTAALLLLAALAACDQNMPAEVKSDANSFPLRASWSATATPISPATVRATLSIKEYLGFRMDATMALTGATPNATYQWRIFRGDCATTAVAANNTAPTGLLVFATVQSYPDAVANASGTVTINRTIAGALDSLQQYSIRFRSSQTSTNWNGTSPIACGNLQRS